MMWRRTQIDVLADQIEQLEHAEPDSELVRRMFRAGKADGRRRRDPSSVRSFVTEAVDLAASRITQQYVEERQRLAAEIASTEAQLTGRPADVPSSGEHTGGHQPNSKPPPSTTPAVPPVGLRDSIVETAESVTAPQARQPQVLEGALDRLRAEKLARREESHRAAAEERRRQHAELTASLQSTKRKQDDLPAPYRQRVDSAHEFGQLLWARYCTGFEHGKRKRGRPEDELPGPEPEIEFHVPAVLHEDQAVSVPQTVPATQKGSS